MRNLNELVDDTKLSLPSNILYNHVNKHTSYMNMNDFITRNVNTFFRHLGCVADYLMLQQLWPRC